MAEIINMAEWKKAKQRQRDDGFALSLAMVDAWAVIAVAACIALWRIQNVDRS